ncbi:hypothetical protein AAFF_G00230080 [Aldrovandia affinis]|uniref:Uncharacterized protein n=1 Tax=Aldrovandia affinis TaxID=143900 RepID=A0AAD7SVJ7_9TELE|nr:hypothetical protein AAFF_G00230080 [Aldrovandia affinis]
MQENEGSRLMDRLRDKDKPRERPMKKEQWRGTEYKREAEGRDSGAQRLRRALIRRITN